MKISTFCIVKNEVDYIGFSTMAILPYVDEIVWADGNSTDGTLELLDHIKEKYDTEDKIKVYRDQDCKNLKGDYQRLFNRTLRRCTGNWLIFLHPDMVFLNPKHIRSEIDISKWYGFLKHTVNVISIAGEDRGLEVVEGRGNWNLIMQNTLGLHQHGDYGAVNEDFYYRDITGGEHKSVHGENNAYRVPEGCLRINHYCETKPYERRLERMITCLKHQGYVADMSEYAANNPEEAVVQIAKQHPRVTLKNAPPNCVWAPLGFKFQKRRDKDPAVFQKHGKEFGRFKRCVTK